MKTMFLFSLVVVSIILVTAIVIELGSRASRKLENKISKRVKNSFKNEL